jgi:diguanylate cyclase (GGDEF)-like protein/PAS domain S-box-containing protein
VQNETGGANSHGLPHDFSLPIAPTDPELYKKLLDQMSDGVYIADRNMRFLYCNEAAFRMTGYKPQEIAGQSCRENGVCPIGYMGKKLCQPDCILAECMKDGSTREAKVFLRHKQGRRIPVAFRVEPIRASDGSIIGVVEIFKDDSARHDASRKAEAMKRLAFLDPLTQTPNRRFLAMSLHTALREFQLTKVPFGVLMIDLDHFKDINDSFGHGVGDSALKQTAKTLGGTLRPTDTVGRWGGDEFLAIVRDVNQETLQELSERSVIMVARIAVHGSDGKYISPSISVGGTLVRHGDSFRSLVKRADELLYESKKAGRGRATAK